VRRLGRRHLPGGVQRGLYVRRGRTERPCGSRHGRSLERAARGQPGRSSRGRRDRWPAGESRPRVDRGRRRRRSLAPPELAGAHHHRSCGPARSPERPRQRHGRPSRHRRRPHRRGSGAAPGWRTACCHDRPAHRSLAHLRRAPSYRHPWSFRDPGGRLGPGLLGLLHLFHLAGRERFGIGDHALDALADVRTGHPSPPARRHPHPPGRHLYPRHDGSSVDRLHAKRARRRALPPDQHPRGQRAPGIPRPTIGKRTSSA
jgi:hypothetical protein